MNNFSIKDIEAVSGIKSHTLRIWEQRYGILSPKRTSSNIRYYDDEDLRFILNISILNRNGYKISEISKMTRSQVHEAILGMSGHNDAVFGSHIKGLIAAMLSFDEYGFHKLLTTNIIQMGLEETMLKIVFPFLNKVGLLWQVGSVHPSHEHFASNIIEQKLYVAIDGNVGRVVPDRKCFLLFLPEHEQHSLGLLFANFLLRHRGHDVLYLGQEVPLGDLQEAFGSKKPDYILTVLTSGHISVDKQQFIHSVAQTWPAANVLLSGAQFLDTSYDLPQNSRILKTVEEFIAFIDRKTENKDN